MKSLLYRIFGTVLATTLLSAPALADPYQAQGQQILPTDWYAGIDGDLTWLRHTAVGGGGGFDLGYRFWPSDFGDFRIEAEANYHDMSGRDGSADSHYFTYMGNLYYDFLSLRSTMPWQLVPYVGAGIGDATIHLGQDNATGRYSEQGDAFAYQFMAGLTFETQYMPNTDWSLGYRYLASDDVSGTDNAGFSHSERIHANNLELAARFHF